MTKLLCPNCLQEPEISYRPAVTADEWTECETVCCGSPDILIIADPVIERYLKIYGLTDHILTMIERIDLLDYREKCKRLEFDPV